MDKIKIKCKTALRYFPSAIFAAAALFFAVSANAAGPPAVLQQSSQSAQQINSGQTNTLTAIIASPGSASTVLVDLELYDNGHNKIAQRFWDNTNFPANSQQTFTFDSPNNLNPGTYFFSIGIFGTNWSSLIHWYNNIQKFTVNPGQTQNGVTLISSSIANAQINTGDIDALNAIFGSDQNTSVLIDLEIHDQNGNKVAQKDWNNDQFKAEQNQTFNWDTPTNLQPGTYFFSVGIFTNNWQQLIHWYNQIQTFKVNQGSFIPGTIALSSASASPAAIKAGDSANISVNLTSLNGDSKDFIADILVYDSSAKKVQEKPFNVNLLNKNTIKEFSISSDPSLPAGIYHVSVGLFTANWGSPIKFLASVAKFAIGQNQAILLSSANQTNSNIPKAGIDTITANVVSANSDAKDENIDLVIYDQNGNKAAEKFYSHENLIANVPKSYAITTSGLPSANYKVSLGVFSGDWNKTILWLPAIESFSQQ